MTQKCAVIYKSMCINIKMKQVIEGDLVDQTNTKYKPSLLLLKNKTKQKPFRYCLRY